MLRKARYLLLFGGKFWQRLFQLALCIIISSFPVSAMYIGKLLVVKFSPLVKVETHSTVLNNRLGSALGTDCAPLHTFIHRKP